jgi:hypothetical protein
LKLLSKSTHVLLISCFWVWRSPTEQRFSYRNSGLTNV